MDCDDRNPSPPPELLESNKDLVPDKLGDSVFSKHWVFQTLINIIEAVNKECNSSEVQSMGGSSDDITGEPETEIIELDAVLEERACTLWDMSANHDVAQFLQDFKVAEIFLEVIEKTRSPRLLEIVLGILGNVASCDELCIDISQNSGLLNAVIGLSGSSDAPTVIQVLRLIHTGIVNKNSSELWIGVIKTSASFMENLRFILENSLNCEVLRRGLQLLYYLLDKEEEWCIEWGSGDQIKAIIDAGRQLNVTKTYEALDELWMVLNLLCLLEDSISILNVYFTDIFQMFYDYVSIIEDYEDALPPVHRISAVAAALSATSTFLKYDTENLVLITKENKFTSFLFKMLKSVNEAIQLEGSKPKLTPIKTRDASSDRCASSTIRTPNVMQQLDSADLSSAGSVSFSGGLLVRKIPSYNSCLAKTAADYDNLLVLCESLEELCAIIRSHVDEET